MAGVRCRGGWGAGALAVIAAIAASALTACAPDVAPDVRAAILQASMAAPPSGVAPKIWADVQRFYSTRSYDAAWTLDDKQGATALRVLRSAAQNGLPSTAYLSANLPGLLAPQKPSIADALGHDAAKLAQLDLRVSTALLTPGHDGHLVA